MKKCGHCKQYKDESGFSKDKRSKEGLQNNCKECNKIDTQRAKEKRRKEREIKLQFEIAKPTKLCSKCGIDKDKREFHKCKNTKDGYKAECKKCRSHHNEENKEFLYEVLPENQRRCRTCGLIKDKSDFREKRRVCFKCELEKRKEYYYNHQVQENKYNEMYREKHSERINNHKKEYMRAHLKTPAGKLVGKRHNDKRRRELGWKPINKWFKGSDGHHLRYINDGDLKNNDIGLYAPRELHQSISHNGNTGKNMAEINKLLLEWYLNNTQAEDRNNQAVKLYWDYCTKPEPVWNVG